MQRQLGEGRYRGTALRSGGSWGVNPHSGAGSLLGQALTVFQRSLTAMQIQVAGLLHFAVPMFPTAEVRRSPQCPRRGGGARGQGFREPGWGEVPPTPTPHSLAPLALEASVHPLLCVVLATAPPPPLSLCLSVHLQEDLLSIQLLLNSSESSLHQLTALLDCRGLHKVLGWPWGACGGWGHTHTHPLATFSQSSQERLRREIAGCPAGLGDGEEAGQREGGSGACLLGSLQQLRQGDSVKAPGGEVAALGQVTSRILGTLTSVRAAAPHCPHSRPPGHPRLTARVSSRNVNPQTLMQGTHWGCTNSFHIRVDGEQRVIVPVQAEGAGLPGTSPAPRPCPLPSSCVSLSRRTTWTPSPASAMMASRACSTWASSPSWRPWPSPP